MYIIHSMRLPWNAVTIQKAFPTASMVSRLLQTWPKVQVMFIRVRLFPGKDIWVLNLDSKILQFLLDWTSSFEIFLESGLECQPWINRPCLILPIEIYLNFPGHQISMNKYHNLWLELIYIVNHISIRLIIHNHLLQTSKTQMTKTRQDHQPPPLSSEPPARLTCQKSTSQRLIEHQWFSWDILW